MQLGLVTGVIEVDGQPDRFFEQIITEEEIGMARDALKELIGDGNTKMSVSMSLKDTSYGTGFGTHVAVTLTCDQHSNTVDDGFHIAKGLALQYASDAFEEAKDLARDAGVTK